MIYPTMQLIWIDVQEHEKYAKSLDEFIIQYAHIGKSIDQFPGAAVYDFKEKNDIIIEEGLGWTQLLKVYKYPIIDDQYWYRVDAFNKMIIVSGDQIVPVYDPNKNTRGFHGELKYHITPTRVDDLAHFSMLRQRDLHSGEFDYIRTVATYFQPEDKEIKYGYTIHTQSGYFNLKGIHMMCWDDHISPQVSIK